LVQSRQALPEVPQAAGALPSPQVVPLQQPSLHGWEPEQVVVHLWAAVSQAWPTGQSAVTSQPQAPPEVTARQTAPAPAPHDWQAAPPEPHLSMLVPGTQRVPSQQPPLQLRPPVQPVPHWCEPESQALPAGQSAALLQPQTPPRQALPAELPVQSPHTSPDRPQAVVVLPAWHTPPAQQAPWHGLLALQLVLHCRVLGSQAAPPGQSAGPLQPQPLELQTTPRLLVLQSEQAPPFEPHSVGEVPPVQVPLAQQPPLHGSMSLHLLEHLWVVPLQASPGMQSAALTQVSVLADRSPPRSRSPSCRPGAASQPTSRTRLKMSLPIRPVRSYREPGQIDRYSEAYWRAAAAQEKS
jgi:hypothetical protein